MTAVPPRAVRAAVSDGHSDTTVETFEPTAAEGWLRVESSAVCGTDVGLHNGGLKAPAVLGHHVTGVVEWLSDDLAEALGADSGQRVVVEEYLRCGRCAQCRRGDYRFCPDVDMWTGGQRVGMLPASRATGLGGGNAQYLELGFRHVLHPIDDRASSEMAAWVLPLANALDWTVTHGGAGPGARVAVIGPGHHGLACVAAARTIGAEEITVFGLPRDRERLLFAEKLGARSSLVGEPHTSRARFDVVVDTVGAQETVSLAMAVAARGATIVVAGLAAESVSLGTGLIRNLIRVQGVRGRRPEAVREAIGLLEEGATGLDVIPTYFVGLDEVGEVLRAMGRGEARSTPHVVVDPWREQRPPGDAREAQTQEVGV